VKEGGSDSEKRERGSFATEGRTMALITSAVSALSTSHSHRERERTNIKNCDRNTEKRASNGHGLKKRAEK
jgi:hypothetical protein